MIAEAGLAALWLAAALALLQFVLATLGLSDARAELRRGVQVAAVVQGVFVATPTYLHKDIVIAALQAGKHVYCEAPMASTIEDARAIAQAAQAAGRLHFQVGQQLRSDPQRHSLVSL